jgi:SAM-dependent methyltransferase
MSKPSYSGATGAPPSVTMNALDWDHNAYYHRLILRYLPRPCNRVLDVGCGAGEFAVELATRAVYVDAIDRSPAVIEEARRVAPANVTCILADVLQEPLPTAQYDAIVSISALHHMPLEEILPRLARAMRPGGVLVAAALPRVDLPQELPTELAAAIGHRLLGAAFAILRARGRTRWYAKEPGNHIMPVVLDPSLTTRQVRLQASALLPGAHVRRLIFWRYFLLWQKPIETTEAPLPNGACDDPAPARRSPLGDHPVEQPEAHGTQLAANGPRTSQIARRAREPQMLH